MEARPNTAFKMESECLANSAYEFAMQDHVGLAATAAVPCNAFADSRQAGKGFDWSDFDICEDANEWSALGASDR